MSNARRARSTGLGPTINDSSFRRIIEASPAAIWLLRPGGMVEYANRRALEFSGGEGDRDWQRLWPSDSQNAASRALEAAASGTASRFRAFLSTASDSHIYLDTEVEPLSDAEGRLVHVLATSRDVTREVEESAFMRGIVQQLPAPLTVKDVPTGLYLLFNRSAEDLYGVNAEDVIGGTGAAAFGQTMADAIQDADNRAVQSFEAHLAVEEELATDTGTRYLATRRAVTFDDAGARHLMTLSEDITDRRASSEALHAALRAAQEANEVKGAFLANMSHEIRTPLNGIIAAAEMLSESGLEARQRTLTNLIRSSGETLHRLLSDILDIARIEAGAVKLDSAPFQFGDLVRDLAEPFGLEAERKGLTFNVTVAPCADGWLLGDRLRIRQIIANLLANAVKFTEQGSVAVSLDTVGDGRVRLTVVDTGIGFDERHKPRIFDRFHQIDSSHSRRFGGSGLGLAICRDLSELMGAELDCASELGRGSRFWLELNLPAAEVVVPAAAPEPKAPNELSILVAEDNAANRKVLELMLGPLADLCMVENGALAVQQIHHRRFDLVLMDMQMPEMDGLVATSAIRAFERSRGRALTPIIMLTANTHPDHVAASLAAGATLHLAKPVTPSVLFGAIESALSHPTDLATV